uniref:Disease resistance R13L4/SHOC-2-like LRR domain-containing protein n=2 Tax=Oryza brachyantha TaxID=4533 RepID=J3MQR3_ORYBR
MPTEGILIHVLAKCGGIPEVIISLARYAASLQQDVRQRKLNDLNANSMRELETKPEFVGLRDLFAWMHVRFDELPQSIKTCILYQSVFYQAKRIRRSHFVRRWIAEGYSKGTESKAMEGYTGELFDRLAKQITTMDEWRFNSFFHEYINSRLMEEGVVLFPLVVSVLEGTRSLTTQGMGQHLVIASSWKRDEEYLYEDMDVSHLQSLTVHGTWRPFFVPNKMKSVRVLDLEGTAHAGLGEDELGRILELLPRLRFLSIRGHRQITHLPDTLSGLKFLQTLDIRHTSVVYVQLEAALQELQYIRAGTTATAIASEEPSTGSCNVAVVSSYYLPKFLRRGPVGPCQGVRMPTGIRHLKNLHTLGAVHINSAGGAAILDDIYHLKQLKKLEVSGVNRENSERLCRSIINHKNLESLSLQLDKEKHVVCWDHIAPPPSVRSLKLYGHVLELSSPRFNNLRNLRKLTLETNSTIFMVNIQLLGRVPSLRTLHLQVKQNQDGTLLFSADLFSELEHLKLTCISRSKKYVIFDERAMKKLELLNVHCHDGSSLRFYGLKNPVSLTQVRVQGISGDAVQQYRDQLAEHPTRPALYLS